MKDKGISHNPSTKCTLFHQHTKKETSFKNDRRQFIQPSTQTRQLAALLLGLDEPSTCSLDCPYGINHC